MGETTKDELKTVRVINVNNIKGNGIKYDSVEEFSESFFRDNYYDAFLMTAEVINRNGNMDADEHPLNQNRIYNMITFSGDRGTGKTSVMYSFLEALGDIHNNKSFEFIDEYEARQGRKAPSVKETLEKACFICLEEIDASLLEKQEDILEVILAKMFYKFEKSSVNYDPRRKWETDDGSRFGKEEIIRTFEKLFKSNRYIQHDKEKEKFDSGESTTEILGKLSQSLTLRNTFQEFIPKYLKAIRPGGDKNRYLVISIDDLDMSADGYEKLEKLHRYLMVPGVIIYLAASGSELESICRKHFQEVYTDNAEHLSMAYLEKVLPFSQRVYLPSVLNSGFDVVIGGDNLPVRDTILRKIIRRTRVAYDGCSLKTHYYEVGNLRTFVNLYIFLDHMERLADKFPMLPEDDANLVGNGMPGSGQGISGAVQADAVVRNIEEEQRKYLLVFDTNTEKLRNDVINRLAANKLVDRDQRKCFQTFCEEDASRREISFVNWVIEHISDQNDYGYSFQKEYDRTGYNYGEFFHSIYALERGRLEYKTLRHCILAIETIMMTRTHMHAYRNPDERIKNKSMARWEESISDSLMGAWTNELLPKFHADKIATDGQQDFDMGYHPKTEVGMAINIKADIDVRGKSCKEECEWLIKECHIVEHLEILFMFLGPIRKKDCSDKGRIVISRIAGNSAGDGSSTGQDGTGSDRKPKVVPDEMELGDTVTFRVAIARKSYTFDVLGFAVNSMYESAFYDYVDAWICSAMEAYMGGEWNDEVKAEIENLIRDYSISTVSKGNAGNGAAGNVGVNSEKISAISQEEWHRKYLGMALPAYSADIMYKLIKRLRNENRKRFPDVITDQIVEQIRELYAEIEQNLAKEDEFYRDLESQDKKAVKSCSVNYKGAFSECPFIRAFRDLWKPETDNSGRSWKLEARQSIQELLCAFPDYDITRSDSSIDERKGPIEQGQNEQENVKNEVAKAINKELKEDLKEDLKGNLEDKSEGSSTEESAAGDVKEEKENPVPGGALDSNENSGKASRTGSIGRTKRYSRFSRGEKKVDRDQRGRNRNGSKKR